MTDTLDPTLHVILVRAGDRREYTISTSTKFDAWPFYIDRGGMPSFGLVVGPERVLELKAQLEAEIAQLKGDGWTDPSTLAWGR